MEGSQTVWKAIFGHLSGLEGLVKSLKKYQKTPLIALIISTVLIDISLYSPVVLVMDSITFTVNLVDDQSQGTELKQFFCLMRMRQYPI